MKYKNNIKRFRNSIIYTAFTILLLIIVVISMIDYVYKQTREDAYDDLHMQTKEIKDDINLQLISDRENLKTMANMAAQLYEKGNNFDLLFQSFEAIGMIENIEVLMPDCVLYTKEGKFNIDGEVSFFEEMRKGEYISGIVKDFINPDVKLIRSGVPILLNEETVGILYGLIRPETFEKRYKRIATLYGEQVYVVDSRTGEFILKVSDKAFDDITSIDEFDYTDMDDHQRLIGDMKESVPGFLSYNHGAKGETFYAHYAPLAIKNWHIMLSLPEIKVFEKVNKTLENFLFFFGVAIVILTLYLSLVFRNERKVLNINVCASDTRKILLKTSSDWEYVRKALNKIGSFANARSAFFFDTNGQDYSYLNEEFENKALVGQEREYFIESLLKYHDENSKDEVKTNTNVFKIIANRNLKEKNREFFDFLKKKGIKRVAFVTIRNEDNRISIIGLVNAKRHTGIELLRNIAVCFSMAVYNKHYLKHIERAAITDTITGLFNREAYNQDVKILSKEVPALFACIYVDVNGLHAINNKYGHAAGDNMLLYIADCLRKEFGEENSYRMGGDEFLVFTKMIEKEKLLKIIDNIHAKAKKRNYYISTGVVYYGGHESIDDLVKDAEKRMYVAKAEYYQQKDEAELAKLKDRNFEHIVTGIPEVDTIFKMMSLRYCGIYKVSLKTDEFSSVMVSSQFKLSSGASKSFRDIFSQYVYDMANPNYCRALINFLHYDVLINKIEMGEIPSIVYERIDGERLTLNIYPVSNMDDGRFDTLWVFENTD